MTQTFNVLAMITVGAGAVDQTNTTAAVPTPTPVNAGLMSLEDIENIERVLGPTTEADREAVAELAEAIEDLVQPPTEAEQEAAAEFFEALEQVEEDEEPRTQAEIEEQFEEAAAQIEEATAQFEAAMRMIPQPTEAQQKAAAEMLQNLQALQPTEAIQRVYNLWTRIRSVLVRHYGDDAARAFNQIEETLREFGSEFENRPANTISPEDAEPLFNSLRRPAEALRLMVEASDESELNEMVEDIMRPEAQVVDITETA